MKKFLVLFTILSCLVLSSCKETKEVAPYDDITIKCGETFKVGDYQDLVSSNEIIATVTGNAVTGHKVGVCFLTSGKALFRVIVNPTIEAFKTPCLDWGVDKATVKSYMSGFTLSEEEEDELSYIGKGEVSVALYYFDNNKLSSTSIALDGSKVSLNDVLKQLTEHYVYIDHNEETDYYTFMGVDYASSCMLLPFTISGSTIYMIFYSPFKEASTIPAQAAKILTTCGLNKQEASKIVNERINITDLNSLLPKE